MDGAGSYSVAHRAGLLPTELTGMWGWILLRSPHQGRGSPPAPAPTKKACAESPPPAPHDPPPKEEQKRWANTVLSDLRGPGGPLRTKAWLRSP